MNLQSLKAERAKYVDLMDNLLQGAVNEDDSPRDLNEAEQADYDQYKAAVAVCDRRIEQLEALEKARGLSAKPLPGDDPAPEPKAPAEPKEPEAKGADLVCFIKCLAASKGIAQVAASAGHQRPRADSVRISTASGTVNAAISRVVVTAGTPARRSTRPTRAG